ncbi:lytic transglycosylase domain-containing protein [Catellatospora chokoriensis]|uniref:Murein transglycosylase n=1 Tax=Catellatospora chokoriensis TaxID=310353 RepID=A0A8J3K2U4_9ACTN|nr:lytic murein transglycosylase [Catellatospora chokoriensis]GIF89685.1 murein transglycosylase [Catellatospora chokoriensis]
MRDGEDITEAAARATKPAADDAAGAPVAQDAETVAATAADADGDAATTTGYGALPKTAVAPGEAAATISVGAAMVRLRSAAMDAGRVVWRQSRRPVGRLTTTGVTIVMLVAATGASGALLIPALAGAKAAPAPTPSVSSQAPATAEPSPTFAPPTSSPTATATPVARPAAAFHRWAEATSPKVSVPVTALEAYAYAEWVVTSTRPSCKLRWTTLAAIGKIESDHGRTKGAKLGDDAKALPPILGPALDGTKNTKKITDTDAGTLDFDKKWDHAVGPMQFIPATWVTYAVDADNDQLADPHDLDDSALTAAYYLCAPGKDLTVVANWKSVVLSYNNVGVYLQKVYDTAQAYGRSSQS